MVPMYRPFLVALIFLVCPTADAQSPSVELTDTQSALMLQAEAALEAQNPALAQSLFQQVVVEGPIQSVYLRLAASFAQQGRCPDADAQLREAAAAPADLEVKEYEAVVQAVEAELNARCGKLEPECMPGDLMLEAMEGAKENCRDAPFWVSPGERIIVFDFDGPRRSTVKVTVVAGETARPRIISRTQKREAIAEARIYLSDAIQPPPASGLELRGEAEDLEGPSTAKITGWAFLGLGAASMATGAIFAFQLKYANDDARVLAASPRFDSEAADQALSDAKFFQGAEFTAYGLGAAMFAAGALVLWLIDGEAEGTVVPSVSPGQVGATWVMPWR